MRQVEAAAQGVAQLVVQGHARIGQGLAAQPGAVQSQASGFEVGRVLVDQRERFAERGNALFRLQVHDGVAVHGIQAFRRMGHGIDATGDAQANGQ